MNTVTYTRMRFSEKTERKLNKNSSPQVSKQSPCTNPLDCILSSRKLNVPPRNQVPSAGQAEEPICKQHSDPCWKNEFESLLKEVQRIKGYANWIIWKPKKSSFYLEFTIIKQEKKIHFISFETKISYKFKFNFFIKFFCKYFFRSIKFLLQIFSNFL